MFRIYFLVNFTLFAVLRNQTFDDRLPFNPGVFRLISCPSKWLPTRIFVRSENSSLKKIIPNNTLLTFIKRNHWKKKMCFKFSFQKCPHSY